jgi:hypothetical protein
MLMKYQYMCIECERMFQGSFPFRRSVIWIVMLCNLMSQLTFWSRATYCIHVWGQKGSFLLPSWLFMLRSYFYLLKMKQYVPLKCQSTFLGLHRIVSHSIFIGTAVRS